MSWAEVLAVAILVVVLLLRAALGSVRRPVALGLAARSALASRATRPAAATNDPGSATVTQGWDHASNGPVLIVRPDEHVN